MGLVGHGDVDADDVESHGVHHHHHHSDGEEGPVDDGEADGEGEPDGDADGEGDGDGDVDLQSSHLDECSGYPYPTLDGPHHAGGHGGAPVIVSSPSGPSGMVHGLDERPRKRLKDVHDDVRSCYE